MKYFIVIALLLFGLLQVVSTMTEVNPYTSNGFIIKTNEAVGNEAEIEFPSFGYRVNLLVYFIAPVLLFVLLLMIKIRQLDRNEDDTAHDSSGSSSS